MEKRNNETIDNGKDFFYAIIANRAVNNISYFLSREIRDFWENSIIDDSNFYYEFDNITNYIPVLCYQDRETQEIHDVITHREYKVFNPETENADNGQLAVFAIKVANPKDVLSLLCTLRSQDVNEYENYNDRLARSVSVITAKRTINRVRVPMNNKVVVSNR